ncbi:MAG: ATP-dependent zinc metalloprotease FtsH [Planctomycetota bacterium]
MPAEPQNQNSSGPNPPPAVPRWSQRAWVWVFLFFALLWVGFVFFQSAIGSQTADLTYDRLLREIDAGNVKRIEQQKEKVFGVEFVKKIEWRPDGFTGPAREYDKALVAIERALLDDLGAMCKQHGFELEFTRSDAQILLITLAQFLPILLLVGIFWFMTSRVRRQMGPGIFGRFTSNRAKRYEKGAQSVTFEDVAGLRNVKKELMEIVEFLKDPDRFTRLGAKIPKGVLLVGPPGTGKTLLARAVAGEAGVPFFSISGSEFIELFVGVGASRVRELFDEAKKASPCIIFIDEIDAVGRSRGTGLGGGHDEREQTLNQILSEMDGFETNQAIIVLAATNRPDVLDPALVRPGRFDRQVVVERPQREGRRAILEVHTRKIPLAADVDLDVIARGTIGFSGADLQNLANEAALMAARSGHEEVTADDFDVAKDKILLGTKRDEAMTEHAKRVTAYHESGHALLAMLLPGADPVHSVTIVPRGRAMGVTQQLPSEEMNSYSRTYLIHRAIILLGGRAAEELVFNEFTTGAEHDLATVTSMVERMVCRWGMSEKLGPVSLRRGEEHVFLGRELGEQKHFSEHTAMLVDDELRRILDDCYRRALQLLTEERARLEKLASALLEREVLADVEIYSLLDLPFPHKTDGSPEPQVSAKRS